MARPLALPAAIAVALLAVAGAGGAGAQTPKRGGIVVVGVPAGTEPACFNLLVEDCGIQPGFVRQVLEGAFEVGPDLSYRPGPRLACRPHKEAFHAHVPHPPRGALERRRPGHGAGLRLHLADVLEARAVGLPAARSGVSARSTRRRLGSTSAPASRAGATSSEWSCHGMPSQARIHGRSGKTGSTTRRRETRSAAARSSSARSTAVASSRSFATRATGAAPGLPRPPRLPLSRSAVPGIGDRGHARWDGRCAHRRDARPDGHSILPRGRRQVQHRLLDRAGTTLPSAKAPAATTPSSEGRCARRSLTGSTETPWCGSSTRSSTTCTRCRASSFCRASASTSRT